MKPGKFRKNAMWAAMLAAWTRARHVLRLKRRKRWDAPHQGPKKVERRKLQIERGLLRPVFPADKEASK